jgi:probable phosphoglycerate mutase
MPSTRLILVRHGESVAQVEGIVGGPKACRGLTDRGRRQVEALRDRWIRTGVTADFLLASTLPRALETAEVLSEALRGLVPETVENLCEIIPGECDGMTWDDFEEQFRGGDYRWDPYTPVAPGGESWVEFQTRVSETLGAIVEQLEGRTIVAAVHGGIVDGSMVHFLGLPKDAGHVLQTMNASVTEWVHVEPRDSWERGGWRLVRFNDHAHLEDLKD